MTVLDELGLPGLPEPLPAGIVDNHTHTLSTQEFSKLAPGESLALATQVGVTHFVDVGYDVASSRHALAFAAAQPTVAAAVALHPNDAATIANRDGDEPLEATLAEIASMVPEARAVGETGLDFYRTRDDDGKRAQERSFRRHIEWAKRHDRTLVIHDRDAHDDVLRVLDDEGAPERVVMHCFSGDVDFARACLERGFWLSYPGVVTFGSAPNLRRAAAVTPRERILVETDAPYLTPKPERGKPNAPYLLPHTVRFLADLFDEDLAGFCEQVTANTWAAYGGAWGDDA
ncbi:TatD family hydrolase [uncultured Tessaracoccus sp.]|uniref:TatD family hydrolase n=1 Tax=uncultured Tessaracoccus sp. TaxID=905023 RepID=UPI0025D09643|nr:TatD family hydrolase [uncultured Tessaracoccus sp.]